VSEVRWVKPCRSVRVAGRVAAAHLDHSSSRRSRSRPGNLTRDGWVTISKQRLA
jgi:hypothetical protein